MLRRVRRDQRQAMLDSIAQSARSLATWRLQFCVEVGGEVRCLRGTASPERLPDGATLWSGYVEDVTESLALEQTQREKQAAESASRAKSEFLSRISHELRTPLNAVLGFTQLMEIDPADPPSEGQKARLRLVLDSGHHLLQMIGDLMDLSRAESGGLGLRPVVLPLAPLLRDCVAMLQPLADNAGVQLQASDPTHDGAPMSVLADPTRLRQVLLNLLGNAVKYNRRGGEVCLSAQADGAEVCLTVTDNGVGIDGAELPRIFEPFYRSDQARAHAGGAGIGLAVTRSLVLAMDGRIDACSTVGQGSTFRVWLPAAA